MDLVAGVGDGLAAARLFAGAAERPVIEAESVQDALGALDERPRSCLFSGGSRVTSADLAAAAEAGLRTGTPVGFIPGWGGADSSLRFARKIASYPWAAPARSLVWSAKGLGSLRGARTSGLELVDEDDAGLVERLALPRRFAGLLSHSSGVDAPLGPAVLCSLVDNPAPTGPGDFLPCGSGGPCMRARFADGTSELPRRVSPRAIAGDVVVWGSCWGTLAAGAALDPRRSLAQGFADSRWAGALITTCKSSFVTEVEVLLASALVDEGATMGDICLALNSGAGPDGATDAGWILFGDPAFSFEQRREPTRIEATGRPARAVLEAGITRFKLPSSADHLVTARGLDGAPITPDRLYLRQFPGTAIGVAAYAGDHPAALELRAYARAEKPPALELVEAIWAKLGALSFALHLIQAVRREPTLSEVKVPAGLEQALAERLERHLAVPHTYLISLLSGPEDRLAGFAAAEEAAWSALNEQLLDFAVAYCGASAGVPSQVYAPQSRLASRNVSPEPCPYCGMPVEVLSYDVALTGMRRSALWCYGCTAVADVPAEQGRVIVEGPASLEAGEPTGYRVRLDGIDRHGWRHCEAALTIARVPWPVRFEGSRSAWSEDAGDGTRHAELSALIDPAAPPGMYVLLAAAVVNGDIWTGRRWIRVEAAAARHTVAPAQPSAATARS